MQMKKQIMKNKLMMKMTIKINKIIKKREGRKN